MTFIPNLGLYIGSNGRDTVTTIGQDYIYDLRGGDDVVFVRSDTRNTFDGGEGFDTVDYTWLDYGVRINLTTNSVVKENGDRDRVESIENFRGTNFADTFTGDANVNYFSGRDGNDYVYASSGNDVYHGGSGFDTINYLPMASGVSIDVANHTVDKGSAGRDIVRAVETFSGTNFADSFRGDAGANYFLGQGGNDVAYASSGNDVYDGGIGLDTVDYGSMAHGVAIDVSGNSVHKGVAGRDSVSSIENFRGTSFADTFTGDSNVNYFPGRGGDDVITASSGNDVYHGGSGSDTVDYSSIANGIAVDLSNDFVDKGFAGRDTVRAVETIVGTGQDDTFKGNSANNTFDGGAGDDVFEGGAGADVLNGGNGVDTASYANSGAGVQVLLESLTRGYYGDAEGDTYLGIENLDGSSHDDNLGGNTRANTLNGNAGNDILQGFYGSDILNGGSGDDTLVGGRGADVLDGGIGHDVASYHQPDIVVDLLAGTASDGDVLQNIEGVRLTGSNATVRGDNDANSFRVFGDEHLVEGRDGDDVFVSNGTGNTFDGGSGVDYVAYLNDEFGAVHLDLEIGTATFDSPSALADTLTDIEGAEGTDHNDTLAGSSESNVLYGKSGADTIIGRGGDDDLYGNLGADTFVFENGDGNDVIADFEVGVDVIDLDDTDVRNFEDLTNGGDRRMEQHENGEDVVISYNDDGDTITLQDVNLGDLSANDFIF